MAKRPTPLTIPDGSDYSPPTSLEKVIDHYFDHEEPIPPIVYSLLKTDEKDVNKAKQASAARRKKRESKV